MKVPRKTTLRIPRLHVCPGCGMVFNPTRLEINEIKEWMISGLCHECQNEIFDKITGG